MKHSRQEIKEREEKLLDYLRQHPDASIDELASVFSISSATIRRDIARLKTEGQVKNRWDGLIAGNTNVRVDLSKIEETSMSNPVERDAIAKKVVEYLSPNDIVFVNTSATALRMYRYLPNIPLTIITNNAMAVTRKLNPNIQLVLTGGEVKTNLQNSGKVAMVGGYAIETLNRVNANKCVLGVSGISSQSGISTASAQDIPINQAIIEHTNGKVIVVADHTKVGVSHTFVYAPLTSIDILITDAKSDSEELERIRESGVEVVVVDETI